jgi:hypothetical protein
MNPDYQKMNPQANKQYPRQKQMNPRTIITFLEPYSFFMVWDSFVFTADTFPKRNHEGERHESGSE